MKKLLLIAAVFFSLNGMAQSMRLVPKQDFRGVPVTMGKAFGEAQTGKMSIAKKSITSMKAAPEGTSVEYMSDCYAMTDQNFGEIEKVRAVDVIFGEGNKVYIPNMVGNSLFDETPYLEGTISGKTISISNQIIGTYNGDEIGFYHFVVDESGEQINFSEEPYTLEYDSNTGIFYNYSETDVAVLFAGEDNMLAYVRYPGFSPKSIYGTPVSYNLTYDMSVYNQQTGTSYWTTVNNAEVTMMNVPTTTNGSYYYAKGLVPDYPDVWIVGYKELDKNDFEFLPNFDVEDGLKMCFADEEFYIDDGKSYLSGMFYYESEKGTYTFGKSDGYSLVTVFVSGNSLYCNDIYTNMVLTPSGDSGISGVIDDGNKQVKSEEYYDMSGRRTGNAGKGVSIKVTKYADGTSKAVKVMK